MLMKRRSPKAPASVLLSITPGERRILSVRQRFQGVGDFRKRGSQILEFCFPKP